jgi:glycerophosphoryl diester phosphodiesterase
MTKQRLPIMLIILIVIIIIYFSLALSPALFTLKQIQSQQKLKNLSVTGHRGAAGLAAENTLKSMQLALNHAVDRIEIDVHLTKDFEIVVIHDQSLERLTNGKGNVRDLPYNSIKKLNVKTDRGILTDQYIPTLKEVLDTVDGKAEIVIEIKHHRKYDHKLEEILINLLTRKEAKAWCRIQSFNNEILLNIHKLDPSIKLNKLFFLKLPLIPYIFDGSLPPTNIDNYTFIDEFSVYKIFANRDIINKTHELEKKINVWTVNDVNQIHTLYELGVDDIITDYPNRIR